MDTLDTRSFKTDRFTTTVEIIEKAMKWLSPLAITGMLAIIFRMMQHGGVWTTWMQVAVINLIFISLFLKKFIPTQIRLLVYIASLMALGMLGWYQWGLLGQGLPFIMMGIIVATTGEYKYWLWSIGISMVGVILIAYGYISGYLELNVSLDDYIRSVSPWITAILVFGITGFVLLIWLQVISQLNHREAELIESESRYYHLFNNSILGIYRSTPDGDIIMANPALLKMLGFDALQDLKKRNLEQEGYGPNYPRKRFKDLMNKHGKVVGMESAWARSDGSILHIRENAVAIYSDTNEIKYYEGTVENISEKIIAVERLKLFQSALSASTDAIGMSTPEGVHWYQNNAFDKLFGDIGSDPPSSVYIDESVGRKVFETIRHGNSWVGEVEMRSKKGNTLYILLRAYAFQNHDGNILGLVGVHTDITDRKLYELRLQKNLDEKEVMLKEIHHRVKNNLQIMNSLIYLQSTHQGEKPFSASANELSSRIQSMAFIHELLYNSKDMTSIHMPNYINILTNSILKNYACENIEVTLEIGNVYLDVDRSVPFGLLFNELLTNTIKHAFTPGSQGMISISLQHIDGHIKFSFDDNGVGFPATLNIKEPKSLGLKLIDVLCKQLGGELTLNNDNGAQVKLIFPFHKDN